MTGTFLSASHTLTPVMTQPPYEIGSAPTVILQKREGIQKDDQSNAAKERGRGVKMYTLEIR